MGSIWTIFKNGIKKKKKFMIKRKIIKFKLNVPLNNMLSNYLINLNKLIFNASHNIKPLITYLRKYT